MFAIDCILHFHTVVLLSCSLILHAGFTGLTHFGQKLIKSTNEKLEVCARKQAQFWIFKLQLATYRTDTEKNRQIAKEMGEKKEKEKKIEVEGAMPLHANAKGWKDF